MDGFNQLIKEIRNRTKTSRLNADFLRSHFHKQGAAHFDLCVLPQLVLFEEHLAAQRLVGVVERLRQIDPDVQQASLTVRFGITIRVLYFRYDYKTRDLSFVQTTGTDPSNRICCQTFVNFERLTDDQIYDIIADFVSSVYNVG